MKGDKPTRKEAIEAQCWECMGHMDQGRADCECVRCPLYEYQPYRKLSPDYTIFSYNPRRKGKVTWEESKREISEEQKQAFVERTRRTSHQEDK
jgi:hypothetical protein